MSFRYLGPQENIVSLEDLFVSENHDEIYIVMELLDCDLHYVINKSNQPLDDVHHRYFMFQILKGVKVSGWHTALLANDVEQLPVVRRVAGVDRLRGTGS